MKKAIATILLLIGFVLVLTALQCSATPIYGLDSLGLAKQSINYLCAESDKYAGGGELAGTFGDIRPNLKKWAACSNQIANRVHLIDGTPSNHACSGNVTSLSFLSKKAKTMRAFMPEAPSIQHWYVSPVLEQGCKDKNIVNGWFKQLKKDWPEATPVCSSNGQGYCPPGVLREDHGGGWGDITSNDGVSIFDTDSMKYLGSGKVLTLAWSNCDNGRVTGEHPGDPVPLPPNRVNWCTQNEYRQKVRMLRTPPPFPSIPGCQIITQPDTSKVNAEFYGKGHDDGRGNKPMLIMKGHYGQISIQKLNGEEVGCFKPYNPPATNGYRYYEGNCSGKTPDQLMDLLGGEYGKLVSGSNCYIWNSIRRLGTYR